MQRSAKAAVAAAAVSLPLLASQTAAVAGGTNKLDSEQLTFSFTKIGGGTARCTIYGAHAYTVYDGGLDELFADFSTPRVAPEDDYEACAGEMRIQVWAGWSSDAEREELGNNYAYSANASQYTLYRVGDRPYEVTYTLTPASCDPTAQSQCSFSVTTRTK